MKIRNGFVSNSSSSSFCIFGVEIKSDELNKLREKYGEPRYSDGISALGLDVETGEWDDKFIGICPQNFDRNKTIKEIENGIVETLKKEGLDIEKCYFETQGWYEG